MQKVSVRFIFSLGILLLLGLWLVPAVEAQASWPYEQYLQLIGQLQSQAEVAQSQSTADCMQTLDRIAIALESVTQVRLPDGSTMPVQHAGASTVLRRQPCNPAWALRYLSGICPRHACPSLADQPDLLSELPGSTAADSGTGATDIETDPATLEASPHMAVTPIPGDSTTAAAAAPPAGAQSPEQTADTPDTPDTPDTADIADTTDGSDSSDANDVAPTAAAAAVPTSVVPTPTAGSAAETATDGAVGDDSPPAVSPADPPPEQPETAVTPTGPGTFPAWLLWLGVAGLLLIAAALLWLLWEEMQAANKPPAPAKKSDKPDPTAVLHEGQKSLQQGDPRRAVRQLFLATLLLLEERGEVPPDRALTNYELLQAVVERPQLTTLLAPIVETFERVWYGFETLATPEYERLVAHVEQIRGDGP
ncbi:MAG: DUF4129 domain-containing protein [Chloroflexota bacterium]